MKEPIFVLFKTIKNGEKFHDHKLCFPLAVTRVTMMTVLRRIKQFLHFGNRDIKKLLILGFHKVRHDKTEKL